MAIEERVAQLESQMDQVSVQTLSTDTPSGYYTSRYSGEQIDNLLSGQSAYQYAVAGGYTGTEEEFQALMGSGPWVQEAGFVPASNQNLLDNWYFGPGVICQAGNTTSTGTSNGKLVDRWVVNTFQGGSASITDEGLHIVPGSYNGIPYAWIEQKSEAVEAKKLIPGKDMRLTVLLSGGNLLSGRGIVPTDWLDGTIPPYPQRNINFIIDINTLNVQIVNFSTFIYNSIGYLNTRISFRDEITILSIKMELGKEQTLARKNGSGSWILNDSAPDSGIELLKCQRYYQVFATQALRPSKALDFRPKMRIDPALGTINIGGVTHYTADANL